MSDEKKQRCQNTAYALVYAAMIPVIQEIGRKYGYAVAVHGSMATDLDLLACPWVEDAAEPEALIQAIRERFELVFHLSVPHPNPDDRPHGRRTWSLFFNPENQFRIGGPYLDISVMPRIATSGPGAA